MITAPPRTVYRQLFASGTRKMFDLCVEKALIWLKSTFTDSSQLLLFSLWKYLSHLFVERHCINKYGTFALIWKDGSHIHKLIAIGKTYLQLHPWMWWSFRYLNSLVLTNTKFYSVLKIDMGWCIISLCWDT